MEAIDLYFSHPYVTARAPIHTSEGCIPEYLPPSIGDNQSGSISSVHVHAKQGLRAQAAVLQGRIKHNFRMPTARKPRPKIMPVHVNFVKTHLSINSGSQYKEIKQEMSCNSLEKI